MGGNQSKFPNYNEYRASCQRQNFSLPDSLIFYIAKNPRERKVYQKITKTCKYFFIKNPVLILHCLHFDDDNQWQTCVSKSCLGPRENRKYRKIKLNVEKLHCAISTGTSLQIRSTTNSNIASSLIKKLYKSQLPCLVLFEQKISFSDLLILKQKRLQKCILHNTSVFYDYGDEVPCEEIIANLTYLRKFECKFQPNNLHNFSKTATVLLKLPHFKNLKHLTLSGLNESFDFEKFLDFLKTNQKKEVRLKYYGILPLEYHIKLQAVTDEILDDVGTPRKYKPFYIRFSGQLRRRALRYLYREHCE